MVAKVGSLLISLAMDSGAFKAGLKDADKALKKAERDMRKAGQSLSDFGQKMSLAVTLPLAAMATKAVLGFAAQEAAMAQVNAALKSMGNVSGKTAAELSKAADAMEMNSLFDAEDILTQVTAQLLTFGNVAGTVFDRAQQAAVDMATRLGTEPQAAAIMLGKALNDPIKGLTALTRVGVSFTDAQKAQIAAMVAAGNTAGAQGLILDELAKEYGGAAAAAADASPWRKFQVALGQAGDAIGAQLLPLIKPVTDALVAMLSAFNNLSPGVQKFLVIVAGIAAVVGPVAIAIGGIMQVMAPFLGTLSLIAGEGGLLLAVTSGFAGLGAVLAPIAVPLAAIAAAGALIYANWDQIAPVLQDLWQTLQETIGPPAKALVEEISRALSELWQGPLGEMVRAAMPYLTEFSKIAGAALGAYFITMVKTAGTVIATVFQAIAGSIRFLSDLFDGTLKARAIGAMKALFEGVKLWLQDKLGAVWTWLGKKIEEAKGWFFGLYDAVVGHSYIPDMVDGIADEMLRLDTVMVKPIEKATTAAAEAFRKLQEDTQGLMDRLFPDSRAIADFQRDIAVLDRGIAAGGAGGFSADQLRAGRQRLIDGADPGVLSGAPLPLADQLARFGSVPLGNTEAIQSALDTITSAANDNSDKIGVANVRIATSFKDMADQTLTALDRVASAVKGGGFLDILGAVINLGLQLGSIGVFGKGIQSNINASKVPGFANGTSFAPGGLALVGERGPELVNLPRGSQVIPNHALGAGGGSTRVEVVPSKYFDVRVQENISSRAPQIAAAGASAGEARMAFRQRRRVA